MLNNLRKLIDAVKKKKNAKKLDKTSYQVGKAEVYEKWVVYLLQSGAYTKTPNGTFELFYLNPRIPAWKKDNSGILTYISDGYESLFLKPINKKKEDYLGLTDVQFWGEPLGKSFRKNDARALISSDFWIGVVPMKIDENGRELNFTIIKWKEFDRKGIIQGVSGMAIPLGEPGVPLGTLSF